MEQLPTEILERIFDYMPLLQQVQIPRLVCQRWALIVDSSRKWKSFTYIYNNDTDKEFLLLKDMPSLQSLIMLSPTTASLEMLKNSSNKLQHLEILQPGHNPEIPEVISSFKYSLQVLALTNDVFCLDSWAEAIAKCSKLEDLSIGLASIKRCNISLMAIADGCSPLKKFSFHRGIFANSALKYFFHRKGKELTTLTITLYSFGLPIFGRVEYRGSEFLTYIFSYCHELTELNISALPECQDSDLKDIYKCCNLKKIYFKGSGISGEALTYISGCKKLETLYIDMVDVGQIGEDALLQMRNLKCLKLPEAWLHQEFYKGVPVHLINLRKLFTLNIPPNIIEFLKEIMPQLEASSMLTSMEF